MEVGCAFLTCNAHISGVLALYCVYVLVMALNGTTEAYVHSSSSATQLQAQNKWLLLFSAVNLLAGIVLQSRLGALGIVLANCTTMSLRIAYSCHLIRAEFR
jgi:oligosaccharide translocation protein RFT1